MSLYQWPPLALLVLVEVVVVAEVDVEVEEEEQLRYQHWGEGHMAEEDWCFPRYSPPHRRLFRLLRMFKDRLVG